MQMKHSFRVYFFLLIAVSSLFIAATNTQARLKTVSFFDGSLQSAKSKAAAEGKPFFIDFTATWCMPCRWMTETTYKDANLANYIDEKYVAVKIDIDDFDGFALKEQYNIKYLPSILVFSPNGRLLAQYEESLPAYKFLAILKEHENATNNSTPPLQIELPENNATDEATPSEKVAEKPTSKRTTRPKEYNFPVLRPEKNQETPQEKQEKQDKPTLTRPIALTKPALKPSIPATLVVNKPVAGDIKPLWRDNENTIVTGLYRFNVLRQPSKGYGVQLGAYLSYSNVISEVSKIQEKFSAVPVVVHIENVKGKPTYKLYLGTFKKKLEATAFLKEEKLVGFVKDYASL
jgi:thiol-disulfide isomerase/thioredoxin